MMAMTRDAMVAVALAVLVPLAAAEEWWGPGAGMAKLYTWDDDSTMPSEAANTAPLVTDSYTVPFHSVPLAFLVEEDSTVDTRVDADAAGSGAGLGAGAGSGKGSTQTTLGDAKAEAAKAASSAVAETNVQANVRGSVVKAKQSPAALSWFAWMRFTLTYAFVVKALCMMCNIFYQASPLPLITEFRSKGDTGGADLAPFIAVAYGGWQWCFYGLFAYIVTNKSGFLVLVYSNVVGATLGLYYVYSFIKNCTNTAMLQRSTKYYYVLACIVAMQMVAIVSLPNVKALFFSGLISSAWSTIASLSLIATVPAVYETKNSRSLPVPLLVMGELSALLWIICGVMLWDPWITFPNIFAIGVCSWALWLCYEFPAHNDDEIPEADLKAAAALAAKEASLAADSCDFSEARGSPLQRAVGLFLRSKTCGKESEHLAEDPSMTSCCSYGGTGGTGDGF